MPAQTTERVQPEPQREAPEQGGRGGNAQDRVGNQAVQERLLSPERHSYGAVTTPARRLEPRGP